MAKTLTESPIATRAARAKLGPGVHWRSIDPAVHLGYRRGVRGGRWLVRWYEGSQSYGQETFGTADDAFDADGINTLSFDQAMRAARILVASKRAERVATEAGPDLTVAYAVEAYLVQREAKEKAQRGAATKRDARSRLTKYVLQKQLAVRSLALLCEADLASWLDSVPNNLAASTVRRLINDLKAALNAAAKSHRNRLPPTLPMVVRNGLVAPDLGSAEARKQVLSDADVRRVISAAQAIDERDGWCGDLARLVLILAATGARFSQVTRMTVADVQSEEGRLMVPTSRKGRGSKVAGRVGVRVGDDVIAGLRQATAGRKGPAVLLERWKHKQAERGEWVRDKRGPWSVASELTRAWAAIITTAELPADTVPYALRHSSIVRGLRAGLPVRLVAALHDTSTTMVERHYAAWIVDALDDLAARAVVPLTSSPAPVQEMIKSGAS